MSNDKENLIPQPKVKIISRRAFFGVAAVASAATILAACGYNPDNAEPTATKTEVSTATAEPTATETRVPTKTRIPTRKPTATKTEEPTATKTEVPTPTEISKDEIDLKKLMNVPKSYKEFLDNNKKDMYVTCPYRPDTQHDKYVEWVNKKLAPALGDVFTRKPNFVADSLAYASGVFRADSFKGSAITGLAGFVVIDGKPTLLVNVSVDGRVQTMGLVLINDFSGTNQSKTLESITNGVKFVGISIATEEFPSLSKSINDKIKNYLVKTEGWLSVGLGLVHEKG